MDAAEMIGGGMGARGEGVIQIGERSVRVLFTNRALARAETALGRNVVELLREASRGGFGMNDVAELLRLGMDAARREDGAGQAVTLDEAYGVIDEVGFIAATRVVIEGLSAVMRFGGRDAPSRPFPGVGE